MPLLCLGVSGEGSRVSGPYAQIGCLGWELAVTESPLLILPLALLSLSRKEESLVL